MDDPFQMVAGFPFVFVIGIKLIAGLIGGSAHNGVTLHLTLGDNRDVKMWTRDVYLTSFFVSSCLIHATAFLRG